MEHEVTASRSFVFSNAITKSVKYALLALVWVPFLGSNYLTITHLITWAKTDHWPIYSTANLFSDLKLAPPRGIGLAVQPEMDRLLSAPAAYSLMGLAIVLSIAMALMPDD